MKRTANIFKKRNTYSAIILVLVLLTEVAVIFGLNYQIRWMIVWSGITITPIVLLGLIGWRYANHMFLPQSTVFTNLMANAVTPSWWGAFYLLFFIVHIGWISDGTLNLFTSSPEDREKVLVSIIVGFVGMFTLICFFPEVKEIKDQPQIKVFVSGISVFPKDKNPITGNPTSYDKFNLRPLVRILQLELDRFRSEQTKETMRGGVDANISKGLRDCEFLILKTAEYKLNVPPICIGNADDLSLNNFSDEEFEKYGVEKEVAEDGVISANSKLRLIIKKVAWQEFVKDVQEEKEKRELENWIRTQISIHFTAPCDYNDFVTCFRTLNKTIQDFDNKNRHFYMNLTPGTVVISSIITLLSIDSGKELYYYSQGKGIQDKDRLKLVDKKNVPLANLLSQALETIKEQ